MVCHTKHCSLYPSYLRLAGVLSLFIAQQAVTVRVPRGFEGCDIHL